MQNSALAPPDDCDCYMPAISSTEAGVDTDKTTPLAETLLLYARASLSVTKATARHACTMRVFPASGQLQSSPAGRSQGLPSRSACSPWFSRSASLRRSGRRSNCSMEQVAALPGWRGEATLALHMARHTAACTTIRLPDL